MKHLIFTLLIAFSTITFANESNKQPEQSFVQNTLIADPFPVNVYEEIAVVEVLPPSASPFYNYTPEQLQTLQLAYEVGERVGGNGEAIQAIVLQESSAGAGGREGGFHLPPLKRYFGIMQMKVVAVIDVLNTYSELLTQYFPKYENARSIPAKLIIKKLKTDDEFSLIMGAHYYHKYSKNDIMYGVVAYNAGPGGVLKVKKPETHWYAKGIAKKLIIVRAFNKTVATKPLLAYNN